MAIRSNKPLIVLLTLLLIGAIGAAIWWAVQLRRPLEARQNPTVSVELPAEGIVSRNSNFEFVFDQKMDHAAVEQALSVVPDFAHTVAWREEGDGERLVITPAEPLQSKTTYRASLSIEALNEEGRPLERPAEGSFTTTSEIRVLEVFPSVNTEMVGLDEAITIRFDQPVPDADGEPVEAQDERQEGLPQPLILDPSTPGIGQWLDDDLYAFYPAKPLNAGTEYQVLINSMVAPGVELPESYRWSFVTEGPEVQVSFPFDGAIEVSRSTDVRLQFAQPMNEESVQESFELNVPGQEQPVTGDFVWEDQQTLLFKPAEALAVATDYQINVTDQATTPGGARGLGAPYRAVFTTVDYLAVESVQPAPSTVEVSLAPTNTLIAVQFNRPVVSLVGLAEKEELPTPITIEPAMSGEGEWVTTSLFVYRPTQQLAGSSEYVVTVRDDVVDTVASTLQEPYSWTFTTEWPRVLYVEPRARSISDPGSRKVENQVESPQESTPSPPTLISPNGPVGLRFNQAMDQASSEAAFALRAVDGAPVAGRVEWQDDGTLLHFYPNTPLTRDAPYRLVLQPGAQGATGGQINEPFEADVVVAPQLRVINSDPAKGAQDVPPQSSLFIAFNAPIEPQNVKQYIDIEPEVKDFFASYNNEVAELYLSLGQGSTPNTSYTITIDGALPDPHGGTLGQDYVLSFTTGALSPRLRLASGPVGPIGTLNPAVEPVQLVDYRNISQLDFALYRLSEAEMQTLYNKPAWQDYAGNPAALVAEWSLTQEEGLPAEANESTLTPATLPLDAEQRSGLYFLRVTTPDSPDDYPLEDKTILLFAPLNLTVKQTPDEIVVWATDMASGSPRADVEIKIIDEESNATVASGRTDGEGLYRYALPFGDQPNGTRSFLVKSYQPDGTINGIAAPNWSGDASPWAFGYGLEQAPPQLYGTLYTERPIYRPGHTIYYKGVLRQREGRAFVLPTFPTLDSNANTIEVALQYQGEVLDAQEVTLSPFGTFHGAFQLSEDAPTGYYNLLLQQEEIGYCLPNYCFWEQLNADFQVAEYEPPTFEVTVDTNAEALIQGEAATAAVLANYYSGGGLADAPVRWNQFSRDYYFDVPALAGYWNWQDNEGLSPRGGGGPFSPSQPDPLAKNGTSTLDAAGSTTISLDIDLSVETEEDAQPAAPHSRRLIIEAIVTDIDESLIAGRSEMIVHAGEFYIGLRPESYLGRVGTPFTWDIATADTTGALDGNREVSLEFYQREWTSQVAGFGWTRTFTDTLIATEQVTTDQNGRAMVEFTPPAGGSYTVLATGEDSRGNQVRSRGYFWVTDRSGSVLWGVTNDSKLELTADKQEYQVGDVARILIPTNVEGMTALISEELFAVKEISVRTLESTAEVIEIPITEEMIPNVYINVVAVSGTSSERPAPEFRMGYVKLVVSTAPKALNLQITPASPPELEGQENEGVLQPGETITFNVQIRDVAGQPVVGELSLAMVDKAVLALAEDRQTSLMDAFYRQRPLSVQTGSSYTINLDRVNETFTAEARGLGGGGGGGGGAPDEVRNEILDTAYWKADLVSDANGEAQVTITLPDNLTTWTIIAKALTADGPLVGEYKSDLLSTKPLIVRPNLPRFFVVGDEADVPVVIHNNSQQAFEALVTFEATGLSLRDGASTNSNNNNEGSQGTQSVLLAPNSRQVVTFPVQVPPAFSNVGSDHSALVTLRVEGGGLSDALEQRLPIYKLSSPEVVASSGVMRPDQEATVENIQLPEEIDPTQGDLTIELAPSLAGATEATLEWLEGYPYESVEAVASRLLANSASLQALQLLEQKTPADGERQALQNALQEQIAAGVSKLLEWQNDNGGWGWWASNSSEDSTPWLTAYTLLALYEAELAGAEVAHDPLPAAIPYLQEWLNNTTALQGDTQLDTHAFVLYVLSEINHIAPDLLANAGLQQIAQSLFKMQTPLSYGNDGRAFLMMALHNTESPSEMVQSIAAELTGRTRLSATGTHWEEEEPELLTFDSGLRSTALVLRALARIPLPPDASHSDRAYTLMPQTVRWLMNARQNGHWESTQESAWAILALTDYMQISGELDANFDYQIALNQEVIFNGQASSDNLTEAVTLEIAIADLLEQETNQLAIAPVPPSAGQQNTGQLYYSAWLRTYLPVENLDARNQGIGVTRRYESVDELESPSGNTLQSTGGQIDSVTVGDLIQVRITVDAPNALHYFTLEDPIPAGFEVVDPSLLTTPSQTTGPTVEPVTGATEIEQLGVLVPFVATISRTRSDFYYDNWSQKIIRDEKVALFSQLLPRGSYEYTYLLRATVPGRYNILPTIGYQTYHPEVFGRSDGGLFTVTPAE
ncbi:MAG: Ig-like domain-containing protein [Ardenticatenaceae bacterium]